MDQIIETIQISKYNTLNDAAKKTLLDKKYTLDDPVFENSGTITIPCGDENEYFELTNVNFVYLLAACPFDLLINNLIIINTKQFSFINPNKTISVAIATNSQYDLTIDYVYGLLKCGDQKTAVNAVNKKSRAKWDRVLKKVIIDQPSTDNFDVDSDKFPNYHKKPKDKPKEEHHHHHHCCHPPIPNFIPPFQNTVLAPPPLIRDLVEAPTINDIEDEEQPEFNLDDDVTTDDQQSPEESQTEPEQEPSGNDEITDDDIQFEKPFYYHNFPMPPGFYPHHMPPHMPHPLHPNPHQHMNPHIPQHDSQQHIRPDSHSHHKENHHDEHHHEHKHEHEHHHEHHHEEHHMMHHHFDDDSAVKRIKEIHDIVHRKRNKRMQHLILKDR